MTIQNTIASPSRRRFLRAATIGTTGLVLAEKILANPFIHIPRLPLLTKSIRIQGVVKMTGKGLNNVAVSDGLTTAWTKPDGTFELLSNLNQPYVFISLPSECELPLSPTGAVEFYKPIQFAEKDEVPVEWDLKPVAVSTSKHSFLALADPQIRDAEDAMRMMNETVPDIQSLVRANQGVPFFSVALGDIMYDDLGMFPEYDRATKTMGIPSFQVPGNHDSDQSSPTDDNSLRTFAQRFGPTYYSFNRGEIHYVVLDDVFWYGKGYLGYLTQTQLDWLRSDLARIESGRTIVMFGHIPPFNNQHLRIGKKFPSIAETVTNRDELYEILRPYKAYYITGHMHESELLTDGGIPIHICGAVCGAWWTADVCFDGTPNGYSVYEVKGSDLRWQYKSTGKPFEHQMRLYRAGADLKAKNEFIANIWFADEKWTVLWYEDGIRKGKMKRRMGMDPLAKKLFDGDKLPKKHTWVDAVNTEHMYYAPFNPKAKSIIVEATDEWGRVYKEAPTL